MENYSEINIIKFKNGNKSEINDPVVSELDLALAINYKQLSSLICSPTDLEDLTAGFLFTSGITSDENKLIDLNYDKKNKIMHIDMQNNDIIKELVLSKLKPVGCGGGTLLFAKRKIERNNSDLKIDHTLISDLMNKFNKNSELFLKTGGVHSSAIADCNNILVFREDIGRHNAIDKVIGNLYLSETDLSDKLILTSGRISSEIVMKVINCKIPIIVSRSAPTDRAIELAEKNNVTLIGFARSTNFNIYSGFKRIEFK
ncbi:MAG: formate dehydrogenase accessory sulfurtransferase FdhD [Candidatus Delongbacteria bacterium]|nr:formate dehydrogenase accessory sulfurtransferase FdhD [Candidatus Delongbacteria bacterium]